MAGRLGGKVAIVTGAAQGIGAAIARMFEDEGAKVWRADIQPLEGERALALDVTSEDRWSEALATVTARDGGLDVLVNNAGVELAKPLEEIALPEWRKVMAVNVDAVFLACRAAQDILSDRQDRSASVINISSIAGIVGFPDQPAYNTSKGAVRHLTKSLAIEWAAHGRKIRCNSIHPGCIDTPMLADAADKWAEAGLIDGENKRAAVAALCPLDMIGAPEDIAYGATYLASDESRFVTGAELVIDGGWIAR